ncbi:MAG: hypothetical protein ACD_56C00061G0007 [uncultured bacterium]|nr:MAG: hypothetical protein ACD_56C00061G0007 [uncultured bacterium]
MFKSNYVNDPCFKERLNRVIILTHDFTWNEIVKTDKGGAIAIISKDAILVSIQDIIAEKFQIPHEMLTAIAHIILNEDWNHVIADHAAARLIIFRGLQLSQLKFPKELFDTRRWMTPVCQEFMRLDKADDSKKTPLYDLLHRASNDLEDHNSKQQILGRNDKDNIQRRALRLIQELTSSYLENEANNYADKTKSEEKILDHVAA